MKAIDVLSDIRSKPTKGVGAVEYVRVSSDEQNDEGFSINAQLRVLGEYATIGGYVIMREPFIAVESAKYPGRSAFREMIDYLKASPECRAILVEKTDRFTRNFEDYIEVSQLSVSIHFVKENMIISADSSPSDKLMFGIKLCMAKFYVDNLSEEVIKGMLQKALDGYWPTCAPIGYMNVPGPDGKRTIVPNPEMAPIVVKMFEAYSSGTVSGANLEQLALKLGLRLFRKGRYRVLSKSSIHKMLKKRMYCGEFEWRGMHLKGNYPPLISKALWLKVQDVIASRHKRKTRNAKNEFNYSRMIQCGHCGCAMVADRKKDKYTYYKCSGYKGNCGEGYIKEETIDHHIDKYLSYLCFDSEVLEFLRNTCSALSKDDASQRAQVLDRLRKEYSSLQARLDEMYDDKLSGLITPEMFKARSTECRLQIDKLALAISENEADVSSISDRGTRIIELVNNAQSMYLRRSRSERRRFLEILLSNCSWKGGELFAEFRQPYDIIADTNRVCLEKKAAGEPSSSLCLIWRSGRDSNSQLPA